MIQLCVAWFRCGSALVQVLFRYYVAWVRCGVYGLCGSMVQVVVELWVTLCKCGSGVRGMVQMQSRCAWSTIVGCRCGCVVCGMVQGWLSIGSVVV